MFFTVAAAALAISGTVALAAPAPTLPATNSSNISCTPLRYFSIGNLQLSGKQYSFDDAPYAGLDVDHGKAALTLITSGQPQRPSPFAFYNCTSNVLPTDTPADYLYYGQLRPANDPDRCIGIEKLGQKNGSYVTNQPCATVDGSEQLLRQWWQMQVSDDYRGINFVGTPKDSNSTSVYTPILLDQPSGYKGQNRYVLIAEADKKPDSKDAYQLSFEYVDY